MSNGWVKCRSIGCCSTEMLGSIYRRFDTNSHQETFCGGEIISITPADLNKPSSLYICDSQRKISSEGLASCRTTLVPINSIILSTRASFGSLAIAETDLYTNQGYKLLVLSGTAQFVANGPEGGIKPGFFNGHYEVVFCFELSSERTAGWVKNCV